MKNYVFLVVSVLFFIGCGGGGSSTTSQTVLNGVFVDSAVEGLTYQTATQNGKTDSSGTFKFVSGETVEFFIGDVSIGSSTAKTTMTPIDMVANGDMNNIQVLNIARVLQSFDSDKNASNGITLVLAAQNLDMNTNISFDNNSSISSLITEVNSTNGNIIEVNTTAAKAHMIESLTTVSNLDPLYQNQWHIDKDTTGIGLNLIEVYKDYLGYNNADNIVVQIVDDGVEKSHEDLVNNVDLDKSYNAQTKTKDPTPSTTLNSHGTMCAGIVAATAYNSKGVRGVAPFAKIAGFTVRVNSRGGFLMDQAELEKAWLSGDGANDIEVSSNSWGYCYSTDTSHEQIFAQGSTLLRDGKGRVYVMAAGNGREGSDSCSDTTKPESANTSYTANNQYVVTVAALGKDNKYASYSSQGSNILVSAYGGDATGEYITTTTTNNTYTNLMNGTSAATPMVAGGIGLVLEACPTLTYRDIKYLLAKTSTQIDTSNSTWVTNSAGLKHSIDYGYGLLNVKGMIDMCKSGYTSLTAINDTNTTVSVNSAVPNNDATGLSTTINVTASKLVEWVGVWIDAKYDDIGDIEVSLTSPAGTTSKLLHGNNGLGVEDLSNGTFVRLSSVAFVDENSTGNWIVKIADLNGTNQTNRTIHNIKLQIVGH
jgi:subtilisin family serine protease